MGKNYITPTSVDGWGEVMKIHAAVVSSHYSDDEIRLLVRMNLVTPRIGELALRSRKARCQGIAFTLASRFPFFSRAGLMVAAAKNVFMGPGTPASVFGDGENDGVFENWISEFGEGINKIFGYLTEGTQNWDTDFVLKGKKIDNPDVDDLDALELESTHFAGDGEAFYDLLRLLDENGNSDGGYKLRLS